MLQEAQFNAMFGNEQGFVGAPYPAGPVEWPKPENHATKHIQKLLESQTTAITTQLDHHATERLQQLQLQQNENELQEMQDRALEQFDAGLMQQSAPSTNRDTDRTVQMNGTEQSSSPLDQRNADQAAQFNAMFGEQPSETAVQKQPPESEVCVHSLVGSFAGDVVVCCS